MRRLIACLFVGAAALMVAAGARAEDDAEAHLSDLAACAHSSDQAVCLVQVAKRRFIVVPATDEPEFAYAPDVASAIQSGTPPKTSRLQIFMAAAGARPQKAATQALRADLSGTDPATTLARMDLTSPAGDMRRRLDDTHRYAEEAYGAIVLAACQTIAPERNHRPSAGLVSAALDHWKAEAAADGGADADEIIKHCARAGRRDIVMSVVQNLPVGSIDVAQALIDSGLADEAVGRLRQAAAANSAEPFEGTLGASELILALVKHGRDDLSRAIAAAILGQAQEQLAHTPLSDRTDVDTAMKEAAQSAARRMLADQDARILIALTDSGFKSDAREWTERFDASGRGTGLLTSAYLAAIAAGSWKVLGESARAAALTAVWRQAAGVDSPNCREQTPTCVAANGAILIDSFADRAALETGHGDPRSLSAVLGAANVNGILAGKPCLTDQPATVEKLIGKDADPAVEAVALTSCASSALEAGNLDLAAEAVTRRAAIRNADLNIRIFHVSNGQDAESNVMSVAVAAVDAGRLDLMHRMVDLAFQISANAPADVLEDLEDLQKIGIAELREQGRL